MKRVSLFRGDVASWNLSFLGMEWGLSRYFLYSEKSRRKETYVYIYSIFEPPLSICDLDRIPAHLSAFHPPIFCKDLRQC